MAEHRSDRWPALFRTTHEPLFLLDGRRRVRHVNHAWEELTGFTLAEVRGQPCKRLARPEASEPWQLALAALAPPAEVLEGRPASTRRRATFGKRPGWWDIDYFPLRGEDRVVAILGKITVPPAGDADLSIPDTLVQLRHSFVTRFDLGQLASAEPAMIRVKEQARLAAQTDVPVLLVGPAGSGKHWLGRAIHQASSRRDLGFACLDCRKLPSTVLTQMLFGPRSRPASRTLYLREPGRLPRELQVRLAQWLADAPSPDRPRILAGQRDDSAVDRDAAPPMLPELLCQLGTLTIHLPPLRERRADFDVLLSALLARASAAHERTVPTCEPEALQALRNHSWPGNLRELYDVLLSACGRASADRIGVDDLPFHVTQIQRPAERMLPLDALLEQVEKRLILVALRQAGDNKTKAAELLGIWRARLIRRMQGLGLSSDDG